jgi:ParB family chromosome partitioning protein
VHQPRLGVDDKEIDQLSESIKLHGLLQPIVICEAGDHYEVLAGGRRVEAAKKAGWTSIDATLTKPTDAQAAVLGLVENMHRMNLDPIELAMAYKRLTAEPFNLSIDQIAQIAGCHRSVVGRVLSHLSEPGPIQLLLSAGGITGRHVRALKPLKAAPRKVELAKQAAEQGWSVKELHKQVAEVLSGSPGAISPPTPAPSAAPKVKALANKDEGAKPRPGALKRAVLMLIAGSVSAWAAKFAPWRVLAESMGWLGTALLALGVFKLVGYIRANRERWLSAVLEGKALAHLTERGEKLIGEAKTKVQARLKARAAVVPAPTPVGPDRVARTEAVSAPTESSEAKQTGG